jgi:hypothetical protein
VGKIPLAVMLRPVGLTTRAVLIILALAARLFRAARLLPVVQPQRAELTPVANQQPAA